MLPLTDTAAIVEARRIGTDYARLRLWGSISFIAVSFAFGQYLNCGGSIYNVPFATLCLGILAALAVHLLKQPALNPHRQLPSMKAALRLAADPALMLFLIANAIHQAALSPYYLFYGIHLNSRGIGQQYVGWSFALGVSAEVLMFWQLRSLLKRRPLYPLMGISFVISAVRWWLISTVSSGPLMACVQTAHAFTFALCYAGSITHLEKEVPEPLRATGRALYSAIAQGLGSVLGHALAGYIFDSRGSAAAFQAASILDLVAIVPLMLSGIAARKISSEAIGPAPDLFKIAPPPLSEDV
jgi:PPP family 3-phenylpropionic acid transporter